MSALQRNPTVEEAPLQRELMLFHPTSAQFYMLNETMSYIWRHCEGKSVDQLVGDLRRDFDGADAEGAERDVRDAVTHLVSLGLLVEGSQAVA